MAGAQHTPGPWAWLERGERNVPILCTPDRGLLYVMDFVRSGMQGALPRFSQWQDIRQGAPRERRGGILTPGIWLSDGTMHPDARLIAAAPALLEALRNLLAYADGIHRADARAEGQDVNYETFPEARAAIRAATGGPS